MIPVIFSAGGGLRACDDELLPCPEDRNGRHWVRVELSTILIKYAFKISIHFWSRRDSLSILSPGQGLRTRAKRTTGKQGLRYTPRPEAPHYCPALTSSVVPLA
jgi:hypothetical protein